jgi:hypothetical protein
MWISTASSRGSSSDRGNAIGSGAGSSGVIIETRIVGSMLLLAMRFKEFTSD